MATYLELSALVNDPQFRSRVQYALWSASVDVLANAQSSAAAKTYAKKKLKGLAETDELLRLAINCAADAAIAAAGAGTTDASIKAVVAAAFADLVA